MSRKCFLKQQLNNQHYKRGSPLFTTKSKSKKTNCAPSHFAKWDFVVELNIYKVNSVWICSAHRECVLGHPVA